MTYSRTGAENTQDDLGCFMVSKSKDVLKKKKSTNQQTNPQSWWCVKRTWEQLKEFPMVQTETISATKLIKLYWLITKSNPKYKTNIY